MAVFNLLICNFNTPGHYQALGRFIYVDALKEQLRRQKHFNFSDARKTMDLVEQLDVLADTVYVQVNYIIRLLNTKRKILILIVQFS